MVAGQNFCLYNFDNLKRQTIIKSVLWIPIGSDPHHFSGSGSGSASRACRSGSGLVPRTCMFDFLPENFNMLSKILNNMTPLPLLRKEKHCELALLWTNVIFFAYLCTCNKCKTWGRIRIILMPIRIRIWIGIKIEIRIRIRIGIKPMPIHNTS